MKTLKLPFWIVVIVALVAAGTARASEDAEPKITGIALVEGEVVVTVSVPAGIKRVILESKTRLGRGAWIPRAVKRLDGAASAEIEFRVKFDSRAEMLRTRAAFEEELPTGFYEGDSAFYGEASTVEQRGGAVPPGGPEAAFGTDSGDVASGGSAEVVESDIWQIDGDRVYFFNQYKGLQVIDIADPDNPVILGTLDLASAGEQMYLLGPDHVVLLARDNCDYGPSAQSRIMIIDVSTGSPAVAGVGYFGGVIQESRMVGSAIYLVSQSYEQIEAEDDRGVTWEWSTRVFSFDLSDPANPLERDRLKYPGYGVMATAQRNKLFVNVVDRYWSEPAEIQIVDISSRDGSMVEEGRIHAAGTVADKFKIHLKGDVVSVVSEVRPRTSGQARFSRMENFSIVNPDEPRLVGHVDVGNNESLFATRFDGDLVYIVTFRRIDPLWIVDNSNPLRPVVAGELEIPGWSNYIHPLGDRLVTIGIDNIDGWRAAVQLFDVSDPSAPALLSKAPLGEGNSWSEANYDEKAFKVFSEEGLILVPFSSYSSSGGYASAVQLIDLNRDSLVPRGVIEHQMQPRRATYVSDRILSISGREFLVVDGSDRDAPVVTADLTLSWPVSKVVEYGDYLVEVVDDQNGLGAGTLTVVAKSDLDAIFEEVPLRSGWTLAGMAERSGKLYALEVRGESSWVFPPEGDGSDGEVPVPEPEENIALTVYDLEQLPLLVELGSVTAVTDSIWSWMRLEAVWPREGVLVWNGGNSNWGWGPWFAADALVADVAMPWWGGGGSGRLIAFDVADASEPTLASDVDVIEGRDIWNASSAFTANGLVYISHQRSVYYLRDELPEGIDWPARLAADPVEGMWMQQYFLDVIDYADSEEPSIRPEINIPGTLVGLSRGGNVIYTQGYHWERDATSDYRNWIDASAYDGLEVYLIDSLRMPDRWPQPATVADGTLFIGVAGDTLSEDAQHVIESWRIGNDGLFTRTGLFEVETPANEFRYVNDLLAARTSGGLRFLGFPGDGSVLDLGELRGTGCYWLDLSNADGNMNEGLWVPMNALGVGAFPIPTATE